MDGIHTRSSSLETVEQTLYNSQTGNRKENEKKNQRNKKKRTNKQKVLRPEKSFFPSRKRMCIF
jgi:hypothetical protein